MLGRHLVPRRWRTEDAAPSTARYGGPDWLHRRRRVLERLSVALVIDVGANQGQYGEELRADGYDGQIVSFEPASEPYSKLHARAQVDPSWKARRLALGARPGTATLHLAANEAKSSSLLEQKDLSFGSTATMRYVGTEQVDVGTLATVGPEVAGSAERILLKLDVQGLELAVLEGAGDFLARVVAIETELSLLALYHGQPEWREVVDALEGYGYALFALEPGYSDWDSGRLVEMDAMFVRADLAAIG